MKMHQSKTFEYNLTAGKFKWEIAPGKTIEAWGFNNSIPGPEIRAKAGDELVVRVTNELDEPTLVHWHGIRLPAPMDGTDAVQKPILPGETFEYRFSVPDAGTFWYHSHVNETVQMERGLYGAIVVEETGPLITDNDRVFMIDDMKLNEDHSFYLPKGYFKKMKERHDGRQGETLLINGKENPVIAMNAGQQERWRFINSSSARYFELSLGGRPFKVIATDGGLLNQVQTVSSLLITPGERYEIIAGPFKEGEVINIESLAYNRVTFLKPKKENFAQIEVGAMAASKAVVPNYLRAIQPLAPANTPASRQVKLSVGMNLKYGMDFKVNNGIHVNDKPVVKNELQVWEIKNVSLMDHPFHLHGYFFQVLEENGNAPAYAAWKDTVNLKPRSSMKIAFMPDRAGMWMYHCHILEHHAAGMMAHFEVVENEGVRHEMKMSHVHHH